MTTSNVARDPEWSKLADADEATREAQIEKRYAELAALPESERHNRMMAMLRSEYELSDIKLRAFTKSRLTAMLRVSPEVARAVAVATDHVMDQLPATAAMREVGVSQTIAREFTAAEQTTLRELDPGIFGVRQPTVSAASPTPAAQSSAATPKRKGWWPFGKK